MQVHGDYRRIGMPHGNDTSNLDWCDACQFGFLTPRPTHEQTVANHDIAGYYGSRADNPERPKTWLDDMRTRIAWRFDNGRDIYHDASTVASMLNKDQASAFAGMRILDLGCGNGGLLAKLKAAGAATVVGVEPSPGGRKEAEAKGVTAYDGTAEDLPHNIERNSFDLVIMQHVLEHCKDLHRTLANVKSLLKPGGAYLCDVPCNSALSLQYAGPTWYWLDAPRHINFFTKQSLLGLFGRAQLNVARVRMYGYTRQIAHTWVWAEQQAMIHQQNCNPQKTNPRPHGNTPTSSLAWKLLFKTMFASDELKYDSLRVLAHV